MDKPKNDGVTIAAQEILKEAAKQLREDDRPVRIAAACPHCGANATALTLENPLLTNAVIWCEAGHVTVNSPTLVHQGKLVFDFCKEE